MSLTLLNLGTPDIRADAPGLKTLTLEDPGTWVGMFQGLRTASGKIVTREQAIRCSAVLTCIRILTEDLAALPRILKRKTGKGAEEAVDHTLYRLLKSAPNPFQTAFELTEHIVFDLLTTGHFFCWVPRVNGRVQSIYPINASLVAFSRMDPNGDLIFTSGDPCYKSVFTHQELWRGTMLSHNLIEGRALTLLAREAIGIALAAEEQGARLFSNGVQTDLALEAEETVDETSKDQLRAAFQKRHSGSGNSWMPLLLEGGLKAKRIGLTAEESQYLESRNFQTQDVFRVFRVPSVLGGIGDKASTYASTESFFQGYAKHTLTPFTTRIEQTAERDLIIPGIQADKGLFITHNFNSLLRADQKTRYESHKVAIDGGFAQPSEVREAEGWDEVDGLDYTLVPANHAIMRNGKLEAVPTQKDTESLPAPGEKLQNPAKTGQNNGKSGRLAAGIAASILRSETREFARMSRKKDVSDAQVANFAAWHVEKLMELTGASGTDARAYSEWRFANPDAENEARERIIAICLEAL